ncbi:MAG: hypothetical protein AAGC46_21545 [Solirubrobacteraceae bacterium]|nr:hypothetical protein [Patulibacter sp.]
MAGCGSVSTAAKEPAAKAVQLKVSPAKFSQTKQVPGDEVTFSMTVTNTGSNPAPGVIVQLQGLEDETTYDPSDDTRVRTTPDDLPDDTKHAPWFVDTAPGGTPLSDSDLYTGGELAPGRSRTLRWQMNAVVPGTHTIKYQVWSGLTDNEAKATSGDGLTGSVTATIGKG